jgi:hypothetical protein
MYKGIIWSREHLETYTILDLTCIVFVCACFSIFCLCVLSKEMRLKTFCLLFHASVKFVVSRYRQTIRLMLYKKWVLRKVLGFRGKK